MLVSETILINLNRNRDRNIIIGRVAMVAKRADTTHARPNNFF